jgi:PAS domain S-box-containing protein
MEKERILILEDSADDSELIERELRRGGVEFVSKLATNERTFTEGLKEFAPSLILSDFNVPGLDGFTALKLVQQFCPETPCIVVSGVLGEEIAVETLQRGATDYVLKDRLYRLVPAARRALQERELRAQRRQAEEATRESEARNAAIMHSALDAIVTMDHQGRILEFNPAAEKIFGYTRAEVIGKEMAAMIIPPELRERHRQGLARCLATGYGPVLGRRIEMTALRADQAEFPVELTITRIGSDPAPTFTGFIRDLSEQKLAERRLEVRNAVVHILGEASDLGEAARRIPKAVCQCLGWEMGALWQVQVQDNVLGCVDVWCATGPECAEFVNATRATALKRGEGLPGRVWLSGKAAWIPDVLADANFSRGPLAAQVGFHAAFGAPILLKDKVIGVIEFFSRQIQEPDEALLEMMSALGVQIGQFIARREAEEALRQAEAKYRSIFENSIEGIFQTTPEGGYLSANPALARMLGYDSPEDLMSSITDIEKQVCVEPGSRLELRRRLERDGYVRDFENQILSKDGSKRWTSINARVVRDANGVMLYYEGSSQDITERKRVEQILSESEERFRQLAENIHEVFWMTDVRKTQMIYVSPGYEAIWGRSCQSLYDSPRNWVEAIHPEDREGILNAALTKQISGHYDETYRIVRPDGSLRWVQDRAYPIRDDMGEVYRVVGIAEDITNRKQAEEAVRESEARKTAIMQAALDAIITIDVRGVIIEFNSAAEKVFGCSRTQAIGKEMGAALVPAFLREWFQRGLSHSFASDEGPILGSRMEMTGQRADGTEFPAELTITRIELAGPPMFTAFIRDITARKRAEAELTMLAHGIESTSEPICITDLEDRFTFVNRAFQETYGYTEAEILGKTPKILFSARNPAALLEDILKHTRLGGWRGELFDQRKDGTEFPIFLSTSQIKDESGRVIGLMGVAQDITERKRAEEQIRLLADAVQSTQEMISITNSENRFTFVNQAFLKAYGYSEGEILGRTPNFLYSPHNPSRLCEHIFEQTMAGGWSGELLNRRKDGTEFPIALSTSQIRHTSGGLLGLVGVARNVSERKRSEKQSTAFALLGYRLSAAGAPEQAANIILAIASDLFGWDSGYVHLYSQKEDKILPILTMDTVKGKRMTIADTSFDHSPSPLMRVVMKEGARLIHRENGASLPEGLIPFGDTQRASASMMYVPIRSGGTILGLLSIQSYNPRSYSEEDLGLLQTLADHCGDAFQRIKVAEALREAEAKYHSIFENATEGIFQTTPSGNYLSANPALARMFGYATPEELIASVRDIEHQTYVLPARREELKRLLATQGTVTGFEAERYRKDGSKFWISINGHEVRNAKGQVLYYEGTNQDITERKRAESVLRESEEKFRTLFESAPIGGALHNAQGRYVQTNTAYQRMLGYTDEELRQAGVKKITHPEDVPAAQKLFQELSEGKRDRYQREKRYLHKDGHIVWAQSSASAVRNGQGQLIYVISMVEDITERKLAEEELRRLSRRIIEAQEVERHRVARDLHDGVNQIIASAKMRLRKVEEAIPSLNPAAKEILARCGQLLVRALEENRRIAHNLRPSDLDDLGLATACRNFCKEVQTRANLTINCRITRVERRWPREVELNLFRIVQEAINNIEKHARAKMVRLQIAVQGEMILLRIQDDGRGFKPESASAGKRRGHGVGLTNMRERAASLGGTCDIKTSQKKGTTITVRVPCGAAE